ncbi:hypothetical protein M752DRAFT_294710 [Aspergillus phoenicis ATCC 13157]|uniref:Uncharacterized protein n=1 Tax=Aspergillus phoenicis ATCC 13157 TaxID=1353007 RepID=A0A370PFT6_ASPPH|nr:hypothetical protein M752DRAFT_294710 [Aspergillus phoenicis ATCC 13157]
MLEELNILIATVVNEEAYRVEQQSEAETQNEIMELLRKMLQDKDDPDPVVWILLELATGGICPNALASPREFWTGFVCCRGYKPTIFQVSAWRLP